MQLLVPFFFFSLLGLLSSHLTPNVSCHSLPRLVSESGGATLPFGRGAPTQGTLCTGVAAEEGERRPGGPLILPRGSQGTANSLRALGVSAEILACLQQRGIPWLGLFQWTDAGKTLSGTAHGWTFPDMVLTGPQFPSSVFSLSLAKLVAARDKFSKNLAGLAVPSGPVMVGGQGCHPLNPTSRLNSSVG